MTRDRFKTVDSGKPNSFRSKGCFLGGDQSLDRYVYL
jgi:hypothetical protein